MFSKINRKALLFVGGVILLVACYQLAFIHTIGAWKLNSDLRRQIATSGTLSIQPDYLLRKKGNLGRLVKWYKFDTTEYRTMIVDRVSILTDSIGIKLINVPPDEAQPRSDSIQIQRIVFEGTFPNSLRLLNMLRIEKNLGVIRSIRIKSIEGRKNLGADQPVMEVFLAAIK